MTEADLYCLDCGYNLRGHSGDPRRCPECGHFNSVADLQVPAEEIRAQLRRMETGPALCGGAVGALAVWFLPLLYVALFPPLTPPPGWVWLFIGVMVALSLAAWVTGAVLFFASCRGKSGWMLALLAFNVSALLVTVAGVSAVVVLYRVWLIVGASRPYVPMAQIVLSVIVAVALFIGTRYAYRWGRSSIRPLQREVAVQTARRNRRGALRED